jgi:hypothetical protein
MGNLILTSGFYRKYVDLGYLFIMSQTPFFGYFFDVSLRMTAYLRLEPYDGKLSRTVLRRERAEQSALTLPAWWFGDGVYFRESRIRSQIIRRLPETR